MQSGINRTPHPQLGGALSQGLKFQSIHHLPLKESVDSLNGNMKHYKLVKLESTSKEKCLYITVTLGPFESKAFTHYNCCFGPI